jgi:hypothetical protein
MQIFLDDDKIISNKGFISFKNGKIKKIQIKLIHFFSSILV